TFPVTYGAFQTMWHPNGTGYKDSAAFALKVAASGDSLLYATYLRGSGNDYGRGIALDVAGNAYVTGNTDSDDFPTLDPIQASRRYGYDAFVVKVAPLGEQIFFGTYLGGADTNSFYTFDGDYGY